MVHVVICDKKSNELEKIISGNKTMLIRGADGRKLPHSRVFFDDELYFTEKGSEKITAKAIVTDVQNYVKLSNDEIDKTLEDNENKLSLTSEQKTKYHKKCLCLIDFKNVEPIEPIKFIPSRNTEDWVLFDEFKELLEN